MSLTMNSGMQASMGDVKAAASKSAKASGLIDVTTALPAAKAGILTTRTDNTSGVLTKSPGHGIVNGAWVTLFWPGGIRYHVSVSAVAGDLVTVGIAGTGDALPPVSTPMTVAVQNHMPTAITPASLRGMLIGAPLPFAVLFLITNGTVLNVGVFSRDAPGDNYIYDSLTGYPIIIPIESIVLVHSDATKVQTVTCKIMTEG